MRAVLVAHGEVAPSDREQLAGADLVIAADAGALSLESWGVRPQLLVGDFDSLGLERAGALEARGTRVIRHPVAKAESDLELALRCAIDEGADEIVVLGAFGGLRLDHALANTMLLADPAYRAKRLVAIWGVTRVRPLHGPGEVDVDFPIGSNLTLLPMNGDATGIRTRGLRYPLNDEPLRFGRSRGLSNVVISHPASVLVVHGVLLVIETREGG